MAYPQPDPPTSTPSPHSTQTPSQSQSQSQTHTLFQNLEHYPFASDPSFQSGLRAILSGPSSPSLSSEPSDRNALILSARCFYYSRKFGTEVDQAAYRAWRAAQPGVALVDLEGGMGAGMGTGTEAEAGTGNRSGVGQMKPGMNGDFVPTPEGPPERRARRGTLNGVEAGRVPAGAGSANATEVQSEADEAPASFQEIMDMIREGKPIPGIKDVPDTVLVGQGTGSSTSVRRKPWELRNEQAGSTGGLFAEQTS